jgi:hypothetical protein
MIKTQDFKYNDAHITMWKGGIHRPWISIELTYLIVAKS